MTWAEMTREQRISAIQARWTTCSMGVIARELQAPSRSAVIGLVHRAIPRAERPFQRPTMTLGRPASAKPKAERKPRVKREPKPAAPVSPVPIDGTPIGKYDAAFKPLEGSAPIRIEDHREGQCRWPVDIGGHTFFCGCGVAESARYCHTHNTLSRRPVEDGAAA